MSIFGRKPLSDLMVPFKFGISILKKPYMQSFMLSAESEHLDYFLLHIRSTNGLSRSIKFSQYFCCCFIVFLYVSAGCVSTFRSCVQGYLEWLPFVFASHLRIRFSHLYSLLTFILRFVIDFLSIRKVIIFSAIATDDRHPLRSRSIHQNAANCMTIRFRCIAQSKGVRKTYCARSHNDVRHLTSR